MPHWHALLLVMTGLSLHFSDSVGGVSLQLSTTEGNSYYVGTKMDAFVFDTLNSWYQEDAGVNSVSTAAPARDLLHACPVCVQHPLL